MSMPPEPYAGQNAGEAPRRGARTLFLVPVLIFAGLALLFLVQLFVGDPSRVPSALIGKPAPDLGLPPLDGLMRDGRPVPGFDKANLAQGQMSLVNVFASWCGPCRTEHPFLMELAASAPARAGRLALIGLNYKDEPENARRFLGALGNPYARVGADRAGRSAIEWGVYGVPETFLVGPDGTILTKIVGPLDGPRVAALLAEIARRQP